MPCLAPPGDDWIAQQGVGSTASLAIEFLVLVAGRAGEVTDARWDEFDLDKKFG
jgi:hypothetical protein